MTKEERAAADVAASYYVERTGKQLRPEQRDTVIDWDDRITRIALPSGLASRLMADSPDKKAEMVIEYNKFVAALEDAAPAIPEVGEDAETN